MGFLAGKYQYSMLSVYLFRHAESEGNVKHHLIGGQSNHYPLTGTGENQSKLLGKRLKTEQHQFEALYSSTAVRTQATAAIATSFLGSTPELQLRPELLELSQGEWEGQIREDIYTPERLSVVRSDPYDFRPPGGESHRDVETRMYHWLDEIVEKYDRPDKHISIGAFTHGFAIKTLVRGILQSSPIMTYRTIIHNTSITVLYRENDMWFIDRVNDYQHIMGTDFVGHY